MIEINWEVVIGLPIPKVRIVMTALVLIALGSVLFIQISEQPASRTNSDEDHIESSPGESTTPQYLDKLVVKIDVGDWPKAIAIAPDDKLAAVVNTYDHTVSIIDLENEIKLGSEIPVGELPTDLAFSGDGKFLYVTSVVNSTISEIEVSTQQVMRELKLDYQPIFIESLPNGDRAIVMGSKFKDGGDGIAGFATMIDLISFAPVAGNLEFGGRGGYVSDLVITPDGKEALFVRFGGREINRIDLDNFVQLEEITGFHWPNSLDITPNGNTVAVAKENALIFMDFQTRKIHPSITLHPEDEFFGGFEVPWSSGEERASLSDLYRDPRVYDRSTAVQASRDARRVYVLPRGSRNLMIVDPKERRFLGRFFQFEGPTLELKLTSDGQKALVTVGQANQLVIAYVGKIGDQAFENVALPTPSVNSVVYALPDGKSAIVISRMEDPSGTFHSTPPSIVSFLNIDKNQMQGLIRFGGITSFMGSIGNKVFIHEHFLYGGDSLYEIDVDARSITREMPVPFGFPIGSAMHPDGKRIYLFRVGKLMELDLAEFALQEARVPGNITGSAISFAPDGLSYAVAAGQARNVTFYDSETNVELAQIDVDGDVGSVDFHPTKKLAYSIIQSRDKVVVISTDDYSIVNEIEVGALPSGLHIVPEHDRAYVSHLDRSRLVVIDTNSNTSLGWIKHSAELNQSGILPDRTSVFAIVDGWLQRRGFPPRVEPIPFDQKEYVVDKEWIENPLKFLRWAEGSEQGADCGGSQKLNWSAVHPNGEWGYFIDLTYSGEVRKYTLQVHDLLNDVLIPTDIEFVDESPITLTFNPDGKELYLTLATGAFVIVDAVSNQIIERHDFEGSANRMFLDHRGENLYLYAAKQIHIYNINLNEFGGRPLPLAQPATCMVMDHQNENIYLVNYPNPAIIFKLDLKTTDVSELNIDINFLNVQRRSSGILVISQDSKYGFFFLSSDQKLLVIDLESEELLGYVGLGIYAEAIIAGHDGEYLYAWDHRHKALKFSIPQLLDAIEPIPAEGIGSEI